MSDERRAILVVDDDERVLLALERLLENEGYDTTLAWTGREGLHLVRHKHFDLVLLDCYLAGFDSREILRAALEGVMPPMVVVMKAGADRCEVAGEYIELGAMGLVNKRGGESEILKTIDACFADVPLAQAASHCASNLGGY